MRRLAASVASVAALSLIALVVLAPARGACSRWRSRARRPRRCVWRWRPPSVRQRWPRCWLWPCAAGAGVRWARTWCCSSPCSSGSSASSLERPRLGGRERRAAARHDRGRAGHRAQRAQLRLPHRNRLHAGLLRQDAGPEPARRRGPRGHLLDGPGRGAHLPQLRLRRRRASRGVDRDAQGKGRGLLHRQGLLPPVRAVLRGGRRARPDPPAHQLPQGPAGTGARLPHQGRQRRRAPRLHGLHRRDQRAERRSRRSTTR